MGAVTIVLVFIIIWWLCFFLILPIGQKERDKPAEPGHATSAPDKPRLWRRAGITTVMAAIITTAIALVVAADVVTFTDFGDAP